MVQCGSAIRYYHQLSIATENLFWPLHMNITLYTCEVFVQSLDMCDRGEPLNVTVGHHLLKPLCITASVYQI